MAAVAFEEFAAEEVFGALTFESGASAVVLGAEAGVGLSASLATAGDFALKLGANLAFGQLVGALFGPGKPSSAGGAETAQGALANSTSNVDPIPVPYGSHRMGGSIEVFEVSGASNQYLNIVVLWGEGEISAVNTVYLDGMAITDARFAGLYVREDYVGTDAQAASAALIAELADSAKWNANCPLSGCAYTYLRLQWDKTAFAGGRPTVTADVDGRKLYDPRSGLTVFSHNPALAIRDYLTNARYGRGIASSMIDDTAFGVAADHCDVLVSIPTGGTQARYTCDGLVNVDQKPFDNLRELLTSCRGYIVFSGGLYKLKCEKLDTPVSFTLSEDNIIGGWSIQLASKRTKYNRVKARFFNPALSWQPDIAVQDSSVYRALDNSLLLEADLPLPFTTDLYRAQQLAQVTLKRSRFGIQVGLTATIAALQLEVGDVVPITHTTPGWTAKNFRVVEIELLYNDEVRLSLLEYDDSAYTLDALTLVNTAPATNLPDPFTVGVPGAPSVVEALYSTTGSAGVKSRATASWGASADQFVANGGQYEFEYTLFGGATQRIFTPSGVTMVVIDDVPSGNATFRVRALNSLGVASSWSATTTQFMFGLTAAPSNVANFAVQSYSGQAKFTWSKPSANSDLDVLIGGRTYVRWSPLTTGATWDHGSLVNPDGYPGDTSIGFGPLMTGTYLAKHVDSSGNFSVTEASFVVTEALITGMSTLATVTESPAFTGAKSNVAAIDGGIQLDSVTTIDSMLTLMDSWGSIDSLGGVQATGTYTFASKIDLGSVKNSRLFASIGSLAFDVDDLIDSRTNNIDDWGLFDGAVVEDAEAQLMVRTTNDDPAGAPTWGPWHALGFVGDYNARGFDFRLDFASGNATHNRSVTSLSVSAKQ